MLDTAVVLAEFKMLDLSALGTSGVKLPWQFFLALIAGGLALGVSGVLTQRDSLRFGQDSDQDRLGRERHETARADFRRQSKIDITVVAALLAAYCIARFGLGFESGGSIVAALAALFLGLLGWVSAARVTTNIDRAGAAAGLFVSGLAVLCICLGFWLLSGFADKLGLNGQEADATGSAVHRLPAIGGIMLSFALGASVQTLFSRVTRVCHRKAVGLYTLACAAVIGAIAAGATVGAGMLTLDTAAQSLIAVKLAVLPLALAGVGILCALLGLLAFREPTQDGSDASTGTSKASRRAVWLAAGLLLPGSLALLYSLFRTSPEIQWLSLFGAVAAGVLAAIVLSAERRGARGSALSSLDALAAGMMHAWVPLLTIGVCILAAYRFGIGATDNALLGLYGIALAAVAMLGTLSLTLAPRGAASIPGAVDDQPAATSSTSLSLGMAAIAALALSGAYIGTVQASLAARARDFVAGHPSPTSESDPSGAYAMYMGNGVFASVVPGAGPEGRDHVDALLLIDRAQLPSDGAFREEVRPGHMFILGVADSGEAINVGDDDPFLLAESRVLLVSTILTHGTPGSPGAHDHALSLDVIAASRAGRADVLAYYDATLTNPRLIGGLLLGSLLTFLFCAMTMRATATAGAQRDAFLPALLAILAPIGVGLILGVSGVMGLIAGTLVCAFALGIFLVNAASALASTRAAVEGNVSERSHADESASDAAARTLADSGQALGILMTSAAIVGIVFAGVTVRYGAILGGWLGLH